MSLMAAYNLHILTALVTWSASLGNIVSWRFVFEILDNNFVLLSSHWNRVVPAYVSSSLNNLRYSVVTHRVPHRVFNLRKFV